MRGALVFFLLVGCKNDKAAAPSLELDTPSLEFGEVAVGTESVKSFHLSNGGDGSIGILSVTLLEGSASIWATDRGEVDTLEDGATAEVNVSFNPAKEEEYEGWVQVRSDDDANPYVYVDLSGSGSPSTADLDGDGVSPADGDCDDGNAARFPGNPEVCDGADNNCDGSTPAEEADADYDGVRICQDDCDDGDPKAYPGAPEICDDKDDDCDGQQNDRKDGDRDGQSLCDGDCDDSEAKAYAGNPEVCDGIDNDCTGLADDIDADGDHAYLCTDAPDCDDHDASAYPFVVDSSATGDEDGSLNKPFHRLSSALSALDNTCRTIYVFPGTYPEALTVDAGPLTVIGLGAGPDEVILQGDGGSRLWTLEPGSALSLENLSVADGNTNDDGGAIWGSAASLALQDVVVSGNQGTGDGGFAWIYGGDFEAYDSTFLDNSAGDDGGAVAVISGSFRSERNSWWNNHAIRGGAAFLQDSEVVSEGGEFVSNEAVNAGGAIAVTGGTLSLVGGRFYGNNAGISGGAISLVDLEDANSALWNLYLIDNVAGTEGGGLAASGQTLRFTVGNVTMVGNQGPGEGAGFYAEATDASGLVFWSNIVGWSNGASGIYASGGASVGWCTAYATTSGTDFAGDAVKGDSGNTSEDPVFRAWSNDQIDNDVLTLESRSPAVNSGPSDSAWNDTDGSRNDRGATGGPYAH